MMASPSPSPAPTVSTGAAPATTPGGRSCYICLQTEAENPSATWVSGCPCSLETHESCLLHWIAEEETAHRKKSIRCPACQSKIQVVDPYDPFLYARDQVHYIYSWTTPFVLGVIVLGGTVAGSGFYGFMMGQAFSGSNTMMDWLRLRAIVNDRPGRRTLRGLLTGPLIGFVDKVVALSLIGPGIVVARLLPGPVRSVTIPLSCMSLGSLMARNEPPTWPPSPQWAITAMPFVNLIYTHLYYEWFGPLEKRLNRSLRGLPAREDPEELQAQRQARRADRVNNRNGPNAANGNQGADEGDPGLWAILTGIWRAVFNADDDDEGPVEANIELEVRLEAIEGDEGDEEGDDVDGELIEVVAEIIDEIPDAPASPRNNGDVLEQPQAPAGQAEETTDGAAQEQQQQPQDPAQGENGAAQAGNQNQIHAAAQQNQNANNNERNNNNNNNNNRDRTAGDIFSEICNSLVTSLMYPVISASLGGIMRLTLPRAWVEKPRWSGPTSLLHHRWGRSLVGGCLFVVLKDAFVLYIKYRRVQQKLNRRVRNVEKRIQHAAT